MSHDMLRLGFPVFQGFPFHMCASVSMFCNSITNLLLCFSVFWHCSWLQAHPLYRSILICVCACWWERTKQHSQDTFGWWRTSTYDEQCHSKPNTIKSNVIAVQHACSSMIIKGNPTNLESQPQCIMHHTPPLLPDVPLIHQSNHRPHHHNGYHFMFLINN